LTRYVVLNPVRAGIVAAPEQWPWSTDRAMIGEAPPPTWLAVDRLLSQFGPSREAARRRYWTFVHEGVGETIWQGLRQQIYLGDETFVTRMQRNAQITGDTLSVPQAQRRPPALPLAQIARHSGERNAAIVTAYATGAYTYREIAEHFGVHLATVGRCVRRGMQQCENGDSMACSDQ
jgi:putative transposase